MMLAILATLLVGARVMVDGAFFGNNNNNSWMGGGSGNKSVRFAKTPSTRERESRVMRVIPGSHL
jgi:hypothetical protein